MKKPVSRQTNLVVQDLDKELLIYDLKIDKAFCLNETSALVWQLCDGLNSISDISHLMSRKLNTLVTEDLVWLTLNGLNKDELLENGEEFSNHFAALSRREVIRKVGLTSIVALPLVSSVVAPQVVDAQSVCCPNTEPTGCQFGGSYTIGCFPDVPICNVAGFVSGGSITTPNHCCNGAAIIGVSGPGNRCCTVFCRS